jgi:hypothetical protein
MERRRPAHELRRAIWRSSTIVDLLLTVATLLVAIYAVVPRARQLDLRLRIQVIDWIVLVVGSLAVTYLQFYEFFKLHSLSVASKTWFPRRWLQGISPHDATYLVILVMMLWLVVHSVGLSSGAYSTWLLPPRPCRCRFGPLPIGATIGSLLGLRRE